MMHRGVAEKIFASPTVIMHTENVQQRRFACTRRPHDRNEVAFFNFESDVAQDIEKLLPRQGITSFEIVESDHGQSTVMPKRDHRISATRAKSGDIARQQSDRSEYEGDKNERREIECVNAIKQRREGARGDE